MQLFRPSVAEDCSPNDHDFVKNCSMLKLRRLLSALSVESHEEVRSAKSYSVVDHWKNERIVENFPELDGSEHPEVCVNTIIQE